MTTIQDAKRLWSKQKSRFAIVKQTRTAVLGDGQGTSDANIDVPNAPDYVWARDTAETRIFYPLLNRVGVPRVHDMPVLVGYTDEEPNIEQVVRIYTEGLGGNTPITSVPTTAAHHQQHEFGGGDEVEVEGRLFQPGLVHPTTPTSMQVVVNGFVYYYDEWRKFDGATSESFTQYLPASGYKRYVLIAFDPDTRGVVYRPGLPYAVGSAQDIYYSFDDMPAPSGNEYPLGWIYLEAATTVIDWTTTNNNIGDARLHVGFSNRNILDRLTQLEGLSGNDPNIALTGAALNTSDGYIHTIGNLLDVAVSGATNGQSLTYEQSTNRWVPATGGGSAALYTLGASDVSGASAVGISASAAPGDHIHRGVQSLGAAGGAPVYGPITLAPGIGISLTQSGASITITSNASGIGWSSAIQTPNRVTEVVYTNGSLARILNISVGLNPTTLVSAQVSLQTGAASPPATEVGRIAAASGLAASVVGIVTAMVLPGERYWLRNNSGAASADIVRWIEYDDSGAPIITPAPRVFGGRLTYNGNLPVTTANITGASVAWYVPYNSNQVSLYTSGSVWNTVNFVSPSLVLTGLSPNSTYDIFGFQNGNELTLETTRWKSDDNSTRLTGLSYQDGTLSAATNRTRQLLGTIYIGATSAQSEDSNSKRFIWNNYNRVVKNLRVIETTNSWTYGSANWRPMNNNQANRVELVVGANEDVITAVVLAHTANSEISNRSVGIGLSSTTINSAEVIGSTAINLALPTGITSFCSASALGYTYLQALEIASTAAGIATWYGDDGTNFIQSGLKAEVRG